MKQFILSVCLSFSIGTSFAQDQLGIASYTVPAGWLAQTHGSGVAITGPMSDGQTCKILIYATEQTAINTPALYTRIRSAKSASNATYGGGQRGIVRKDANGLTSFMSMGSIDLRGKKIYTYFYSFTNNQQSFYIELQADNAACVETFNQFLAGIEIDEPQSATGRAKKAAPAAPAAPAPMM